MHNSANMKNRHIKCIHVVPFLVVGLRDIDLIVLDYSFLLDFDESGFGCVAEAAVGFGEEGEPGGVHAED